MSVEYDRIYELETEGSPDLDFEIGIDKDGSKAATRLTLNNLSELIITEMIDLIWPIGVIGAWHKSFAGVPVLSDRFLEIDGSVINDPDSPLDGETLPDWNGDERFLRGHATTSGTEEADQLQGFQVGCEEDLTGARNYYMLALNRDELQGAAAQANYTKLGAATIAQGDSKMFKAMNNGTDGDPRTGTETRAINASVIWIMRIK